MNPARWIVGAGVLLGGTLAAASDASAYVRYQTQSGKSFAWAQSCVQLTAYPGAFDDLTPTQVKHAVTAAAAAWSKAENPCTYLDIQVAEATGTPPSAALDNRNVLLFRDSWCRENDPSMCHDPAALAITSLVVRVTTGAILDADMEVNATHYLWADLEIEPTPTQKQDLQNALTHEMGHLIGLDHNCFMPLSTLTRPIDNMGQLVPDCYGASEAIRSATMFPAVSPGDVARRSLEADDRLAVCEVYPAAQDPMLCGPSDGGSADAADAQPAADATDLGVTETSGADHPSTVPEQGCGCRVNTGPPGWCALCLPWLGWMASRRRFRRPR